MCCPPTSRTEWPGDVALKVRDNILKQLKEGTSSNVGDVSSMSETEDVEMTGAGQRGPPIGGTPGESSSGTGRRATSPTTGPKAPPKALVTKEMMTAVRPKSPPNPPRSPRVSSPPCKLVEVTPRFAECMKFSGTHGQQYFLPIGKGAYEHTYFWFMASDKN